MEKMTQATNDKGSGRDLRLDLFRGLANWAIFLDHVPNNLVAWITARNYGFSDAAELFVFVSGLTVAFVYGRMMRTAGFFKASVGVLGRVWQIYVAYILLFVFYVVAIGYVAQRYGHAHLLDEFNIRLLIAEPVEFIKHGLLLEYRPLNLDVLPLYIVLMAPFPPVLWLLTKAPNITLGASLVLYVVARQMGWNLSGYPSGTWYFNPFAWQLLFVIGAWTAVTDRTKLHTALRSPIVMPICIAMLVLSAVVTVVAHTGNEAMLPEAVRSFFIPNDKTNLAPYRIIHFLALAIVVSRLISRDAPALKWPVWRPIIVCGQQSLEVFCAGVFLAFVAYFAIDLVSEAFWFQLLVSIAGIAAMIGVAYFRKWAKAGKAKPAKTG
ncbi:OpgC domain-containing protein [Rhodopseudomonas boonkerdii]|nr:OpgC domain-containing protein [Rhodopseudomonas boonkerdii]UGV26973.1 OpgC domain-containing protein [Rhodopseudomonas boonkerdii]